MLKGVKCNVNECAYRIVRKNAEIQRRREQMKGMQGKLWITVWLLLVTTIINCNVLEVSAETTVDGYEYSVLDDGTVEIIGYTGTVTELIIPSEIDGKKVTSIGDQAFYYTWDLADIEIPDSVTSIGIEAFYGCNNLTNITLSNNLTSINVAAFFGCSSLTKIKIPKSVTSIGDNAFQNCLGLKEIEFSEGLINIRPAAFYNCSGLSEIKLPKSVKI